MNKSLILFAILAGLAFWGDSPLDPDLGWHLFGGAWIVTHRALPSFDPINTFGDSWVDYHWLAQVIFYSLFRLGGYPAIALFFGVLMCGMFVSLSTIIRRSAGPNAHPLVELSLLIVSSVITTSVFSFRPQIIALTIVSGALALLLSKSLNYSARILLAVFTIICANIHVYWVFIPLLHIFYQALPFMHRGRRPHIGTELLFAFLLIGCGAVSPYGIQNLLVPMEYASMDPRWKSVIGEFNSSLLMGGIIPFLLIGYVAVALFKPRLHLNAQSISGLGSLILALIARKFLGVFGILGLPLLAHKLAVWCRLTGLSKRSTTNARAVQALIYSLCVLAGGGVVWRFPVWGRNYQGEIAALYPIDACRDFVVAAVPPRTERQHIRILTHFNHGGWCRWGAYLGNPDIDIRVTTDGRTQYVPFERYQWSYDIVNAKPGWETHLAEWSPDAILLNAAAPLAEVLKEDTRWRLGISSGAWKIYSTSMK